uniref:T7N9.28 n=1 Tax=Arabidopsis thaliana TaxID=3702 RepID=Q9LFX0_ARATH|nr:T7N9.28 [Arabidopsis thaliana]
MSVVLQITKDWVQALLGFLLLSFANISTRTNHKHFPHGSCSSIMAGFWIYMYIYSYLFITLKIIDLTSVKFMNTSYYVNAHAQLYFVSAVFEVYFCHGILLYIPNIILRTKRMNGL